MVDTPRLVADLQSLLANGAPLTTAQDLRDFLVSAIPTGRAATKVVASVAASDQQKAQADYVCDGTADQVQIQAALDAVDSDGDGGTVYLTEGEYQITATITVPSFTRLTGPGKPWHSSEITGGDPAGYYGADLYAAGGLNFNMFTNKDTTNGNTGIEIDHLRLDQRGCTGDVDVMRFTLLWRSNIHDCNFLGATGTTNKRGIKIVSGEEIHVERNRFDTCGLYCAGNALGCYKNDFGASGIYGIELLNGFGHRIVDNHIYNTSKDGISAFNIIGCVIQNNHIEDCDWHGMYFANKLQYSVIALNVVKQNSKASAGTRNGITIDSDTAASPSTKNVVSGNVCIDTQGTPTQQYGIALASFSGTQTIDNLITNNQFFGNSVAGFNQKAGMANIVRNNSGWVTENSGTGSIVSGTTSIAITHGLSVTPVLKDISITLGELSTTDPGQIYVDTIGATQFTVRCRTNPGASNLDFAWRVAVL